MIKKAISFIIVTAMLLGLFNFFIDGQIKAAYAENLLYDDFEDGNADGWTADSSWSIVNDITYRYQCDINSATDKYASAGKTTWTNYSVQAVCKPKTFYASNKAFGICARYTDENNNYRFFYSGYSGAWKLIKIVNGVSTVLDTGASYTASTDEEYTVKLIVNGTSIEGYVNGVLQCQADDTALTQGKAALEAFYIKVSFDNVSVDEMDSSYLLYDTFNNQVTGSQPLGWEVSTVSGTVSVEEFPSSTDKSVRIYDNDSSGAKTASKGFASQSATVLVEFDFQMPVVKEGALVCYLQDSKGTNAVSILASGNGYFSYFDGSTQTNIQTYTAGTWYHFKIVANAQTNKMDLYINGVSRVNQRDFRNEVDSIDKIMVGGSTYGYDVTAYWDNIKVYALSFYDDFEDGNADGWTADSSWSIVNDITYRYQCDINSATDKYASAGESGWTDYGVSAVCKPTTFYADNKAFGICARYTNENNNYRFFYSGYSGAWKLIKIVNGTSEVLNTGSSYNVSEGTEYTVRLEVFGTSLKGYVNGVLQCEAVDSSLTSGGIALEAYYIKTTFDDVYVDTNRTVDYSANSEIPDQPDDTASGTSGVYNGEGNGITDDILDDGLSDSSQYSQTITDESLTVLKVVDNVSSGNTVPSRTQVHFMKNMTGKLTDGDTIEIEAKIKIVSWENGDDFSNGAARAISFGFNMPFGVAYHSVAMGIIPDMTNGSLHIGLIGKETIERDGYTNVITGVDFSKYHTYKIRKVGYDKIELYFDGELKQTLDIDYIYTTPRLYDDNTRNGMFFGAASGYGKSETYWDYVTWNLDQSPLEQKPKIISASPAVEGEAVYITFEPIRMAKSYTIMYGTSSGNYTNSVTGVRNRIHKITGLSNGTIYYFAVKGVNDSYDSAISNEVSCIPDNRIDILPLGDVTMFFPQNGRDNVYTSYRPSWVTWATPQKLNKEDGGRTFSMQLWNSDYTENLDWRAYVDDQYTTAENNSVKFHRVINMNLWDDYFKGGPGANGIPFDYNWSDAYSNNAMDFNNPISINFFKKLIDYYCSFNVKPEGIHYDDCYFKSDGYTLGSINKFNYYLNSHLSDQELSDAGITDVFKFNIKNGSPNSNISNLWSQFKSESCDKLIIDTTCRMRKLLGKWVPAAVTPAFLSYDESHIMKVADYASQDDTTGISNTVSNEVMSSSLFNNKMNIIQWQNVCGSGDSTFMKNNPLEITAYKMHVAAHYARGDFMVAPHDQFGGTGSTWDPDPLDYKDIFEFIAGNKNLFNNFKARDDSNVYINGAENVKAIARKNLNDPDTIIIHVVNQSYDSSIHEAVEKNNFKVVLNSNIISSGKSISSATMYRYDGTTGISLTVNQNGPDWEIIIPSLKVWDIIKVVLQ